MTLSNQQGTPRLLREINEHTLLEHLWHCGPTSRAQLARTTGLSKPTVSQALANLEQAKLVRPSGQIGSGGRMATLYEPDPTAGYVVGIDIGSSWIRTAIADLTGTIIERRDTRNHEHNAMGLVDTTRQLVNSTLAAAHLTQAQIIHTVIGSPGTFDRQSSRILFAPNLPGWEQPQLMERLQEEFGPHFTIENDINLAALGERTYGCGKEVETFVFLSVGSGLGMGIIINGALYRGVHGVGGEIGFLPYTIEGTKEETSEKSTQATLRPVPASSTTPITPVTPITQTRSVAAIGQAETTQAQSSHRGQLEEATSAEGIVQMAFAHGMRAPLSAKRIFDAARAGDQVALGVIEHEGQLLAHAIATVLAILDPALIVLGGGIGLNIDLLHDPIERCLRAITPIQPPRIVASKLGIEATLFGALITALETAREHVFQHYMQDEQ